MTRWWQLKYVFFFHPENWGRCPIWLIFFNRGWSNHQPGLHVILCCVLASEGDRSTLTVSEPPKKKRWFWMTKKHGVLKTKCYFFQYGYISEGGPLRICWFPTKNQYIYIYKWIHCPQMCTSCLYNLGQGSLRCKPLGSTKTELIPNIKG